MSTEIKEDISVSFFFLNEKQKKKGLKVDKKMSCFL